VHKLVDSYGVPIADLLRPGANLSGVDLSGGSYIGVNLNAADLSNSILRGTDLSNSSFVAANFYNADIRGTNFTGAIMLGADLRNTDISAAIFDKANIALSRWPRDEPLPFGWRTYEFFNKTPRVNIEDYNTHKEIRADKDLLNTYAALVGCPLDLLDMLWAAHSELSPFEFRELISAVSKMGK
jgi:hypothetical protein